MNTKPKEASVVFICGLVGIIAVILTIICDFILIGRPNSSHSFLKLGTESMYGLSQWRIYIGTFAGILVLPLQAGGLVPFYYGLKPAGKTKALIASLVAGHAVGIAAGFHLSYAFIASGWDLFHSVKPQDAAASQMIRNFDIYWKITIVIMALDLFISSAIYIYLLIKKNTLYPKWMALLSPIFVFLYTYILVMWLPHPVGGFIAPAFLNFSTLIFFIFSTKIVHKTISYGNDKS